jgi:hypothetical protein
MMIGLQAKLAALGAFLLAVLAAVVRMKSLKNQRDRARQVSETLESRLKQQQNQKKIKREEEKKALSRSRQLAQELEEKKALSNLTDSNDF